MKQKNAKRKTPDNSALVEKESKNEKWFDYQCIYTGSLKPINERGIDKLACEIVAWAKNDDEAFKISQFYLDKGICEQTWWRWCNAYPRLKEAHTTAKSLIGNRREIGAIKKKLDSGTVNFTMPHYDREWRENIEWRASLREKKDEASTGPQIVVMERIADSPLVPVRKKDE